MGDSFIQVGGGGGGGGANDSSIGKEKLRLSIHLCMVRRENCQHSRGKIWMWLVYRLG